MCVWLAAWFVQYSWGDHGAAKYHVNSEVHLGFEVGGGGAFHGTVVVDGGAEGVVVYQTILKGKYLLALFTNKFLHIENINILGLHSCPVEK